MERYNPWWNGEPNIGYIKWTKKQLRWVPDIIHSISLKPFALHFLTGPRQVGKTTALRILVNQLLEGGREPRSVFYYSCDELTDHNELGEVLDNYLKARKQWGIGSSIILLDEIPFVDEWWRAIKSRVDLGVFEKDVLIVTGSLSLDILKQKERFPGRRGNGSDHVLYPLNFRTYAKVVGGLELQEGDIDNLNAAVDANRPYDRKLRDLLEAYMESGGFPLAIQDKHQYGRVSPETERAYLDWMKGDWNKAGKSDRYMKEVFSYLCRARGTPVSWNNISTETSIRSSHTARSYIETLESMHAVLVLHKIKPDGQIEYKKNKKIHFTDPFIYRIACNYTGSEYSYEWAVEAVSAAHLSRIAETYYWRGKTECDIVALRGGRQIGFEITTGVKRWKAPWHLKKRYLLDKKNVHLYLSGIQER